MEMFDELDEMGRFTGGMIGREDAHKNGARHRAVLLFLLNDKNQILMQKRSRHKSLWAGRWDGTGGGHVESGAIGLFSVIRELKEELGIAVDPCDVRYIGGCLSENKSEELWNRHFNEFYVVHKNVDAGDVKLQASEVEAVQWVDFDRFKQWTASRSAELTEKWEAFDALVRYVENYVPSPNSAWMAEMLYGREYWPTIRDSLAALLRRKQSALHLITMVAVGIGIAQTASSHPSLGF